MRKTMFAVAALSLASLTSAQADDQNGKEPATAQLVKECSHNEYRAWDFCTITSSNIPQIPVGSVVYYTSSTMLAPNHVKGLNLVDSNVVLVAGPFPGHGSVATGRCTYDFQAPTNIGLCHYTDGIGELAGFEARLVVTPSKGANSYLLTGPYQFKSVNNKPS